MDRVCVDLKRNASSMITDALKMKFSSTAALSAAGRSWRYGFVAGSTPYLYAGFFAKFQRRSFWCARQTTPVFEAAQTFRSLIQSRFRNQAFVGIEFLVNRWSDKHSRRNDFALRFNKSGATEVCRSGSNGKSHKFGLLSNAIGLQSANRKATSNVTGLSAVGMACPLLSNHDSQKNQIHAIRLYESCLGSPVNCQQRMNSNEKNNAHQRIASRGKSDCDC